MRLLTLTFLVAAATLSVHKVGGLDPILEYFTDWNNVPTDIYLGVMTESADVTKTSLVNGTCFQYDVNDFDRCKFYSDCCAMTPTRSLEQLAAKTFSCHDGNYLVDKCPLVTENRELRDLCEVNSGEDSDISMKRWPVRGLTNHLVYKNIYCAMCNAINPYKETVSPEVEWWPASIECTPSSIQDYINDEPNHDKLINLISSSCDVLFLPPETPDLCWESERTCPDGSSEELTKLCEKGPANYINITVNKIYRNQFCALCNGVSIDTITHPELVNYTGTLQLKWLNDKLHHVEPDDTQTAVLTVLRPTLFQNESYYSLLNFTDFNNLVDIRCSEFVDDQYNNCRRAYIEAPLPESNGTTPVWNLKSVACYSSYTEVCDHFLVTPTSECADPGCGKYSILDLQTLECVNVSNLVIGDEKVLETNDLPWHSQSICAYHSQCKLVKLGLMQPNDLNCFCDEQCIYYNDCCEDSPYQATKETKLPPNTFSCKDDNEIEVVEDGAIFWGIMEVDRCPEDYADQQTKTLCEEIYNYTFEIKVTQQTIPVTDYATGARYANMYCAQCHNVQDIRFWTMEIGCFSVYNDECAFSTDSQFRQQKVSSLRNDPTLEQLNRRYISSDCSIKQYLPPEEIPTVRRCKYDAMTYIATCPEHTKDWVIAQKCENAPTSFVYEGGTLGQLISKVYSFEFSDIEADIIGVAPLTEVKYVHEKKFRNSHCASCHSVAWQGCNAFKSFETNNTKLYQQYWSGVTNYLFTYRIDLNKRSCIMDSDATLLYSDYTTGYDTCKTISNQLKQCNCQSMLNLETGQCREISYNNSICLTNNYETETFQLSSYATQNCDESFSYKPLSLELAGEQCQTCTNISACTMAYEWVSQNGIPIAQHPLSVHCALSKILRCGQIFGNESCATMLALRAFSSDVTQFPNEAKIPLLNSVAIAYSPSMFDFKVEVDTITIDGFEQVFATFTDNPLATCSEYSHINGTSQQWLVCNGNILYDVTEDILYPDYLLRGEELIVCTEYAKPEFELQVYNYIFSAFSIAAITSYILYYFVKARRSVTGNFVVSSLLTLAAGLVCYCLINQVGSVVSCRIIASLSQYFLLSVHTWTNAIGIWMIRGITSFRIANDFGWKTYMSYAAYAWLTPLFFVILAYVMDAVRSELFYPMFAGSLCFIASGWSRLLVFTGPIYLCILINSILCIVATVKISGSGSRVTSSDKARTKKKIITVIKLQIIFGFHWILLLFTLIDGPHQSVIWSILNVLLTLQGVFVVLSQILSVKNVDKLKSHMQRHWTSDRSSANPNNSHRADTAELENL